MTKSIVLTASHYNWSLVTRESWYKTDYILYTDGALRCINHKGSTITEEEARITKKDLAYIKKNTEAFIGGCKPVNYCDGTAWEIDYNGLHFGTDYVYDSDLESVTNILFDAYHDK